MTWLDRLRQLDTRLTNGEISAADYRKARDEILAEASSGKRPVGGESPKGESWIPAHPAPLPATPPSPPAAPPTPAAPQPPAAAAVPEAPLLAGQSDTQADTQAADTGETTQVIASEEPTVAEVRVDDEPTQVVATNEEDETEVVKANVVAAATPAARPVPEVPEFAPRVPRPQYARSTPIQGEEVFAEARATETSLAVRILVPLTILAVIGVAVWWFAFRQDSSAPAAQGEDPPVSASQAPPQNQPPVPTAGEVADKVPTLPGQVKPPRTGTVTATQAQNQKLLNAGYVKFLTDNGVQDLVYRKASRQQFGYVLVAAPVEPSGGAADLATATSDSLKKAGFAPAERAKTGNVPVITRNDQFFRTFVAMYASGDVWVQLNVSGPPNGNAAALRTEFDKVLSSVTKELPAA